jgi:hypothetical protein
MSDDKHVAVVHVITAAQYFQLLHDLKRIIGFKHQFVICVVV